MRRASQAERRREGHAHRRAAGDAQDERIGERIAQEGLERRADRPQQGAHQEAEPQARHPEVPDDRARRVRPARTPSDGTQKFAQVEVRGSLGREVEQGRRQRRRAEQNQGSGGAGHGSLWQSTRLARVSRPSMVSNEKTRSGGSRVWRPSPRGEDRLSPYAQDAHRGLPHRLSTRLVRLAEGHGGPGCLGEGKRPRRGRPRLERRHGRREGGRGGPEGRFGGPEVVERVHLARPREAAGGGGRERALFRGMPRSSASGTTSR